MRNRIIQGDCIDIMRTISNSSIDLCIIDPPYNVNYQYNSYKDNLSFKEYLHWQLDVLKEVERVLKLNGSLFYLNYPEFNSHVYCNLESDFDLKPIEIITWVYNTHTGGKILRKSSRTWVWASKGSPVNRFKGEYRNPMDKRVQKLIAKGKKPKAYDWWLYEQVKNVSKEKTEHPCQLPVAMIKYIIESTTLQGDTVLDPFAGACTTAVASLQLNRNYIMIEKDESYVKIGQKRVKVEDSLLNFN